MLETEFYPEGHRLNAPENLAAISSPAALSEAQRAGRILESRALMCDGAHNLIVDLGCMRGLIPREEGALGIKEGAVRDIAILSRVNRPVSFIVRDFIRDESGRTTALLSRRAAQERAMAYFLERLEPGSVLTGRVTRLESFGAFVDVGCGIVAMLPIEHISVSRISHPRERFQEGQKILTAVWSLDREARRITLTHRELLGTWMDNASRFRPGETVRGVVRTVKDYGSFIELAPNLSGLADAKERLSPGDGVSVYIKSIRPERMKIKLQVIEKLPPAPPEPMQYQITDGKLDRWVYSPPNYEKPVVETVFTAPSP